MVLTRRHLIGLLGVGSLAVAGCLGDDDGPSGTPTSDAEIIAQTATFSETFVWIDPGDSVTFTHEAGSHTVTLYHEDNDVPHRAPENAVAFDREFSSGELELTFEEEGVYGIFCRPHEMGGMATAVVVGQPEEDEPGLAPPQEQLPSSMQSRLSQINDEIKAAFDMNGADGDHGNGGGDPGY